MNRLRKEFGRRCANCTAIFDNESMKLVKLQMMGMLATNSASGVVELSMVEMISTVYNIQVDKLQQIIESKFDREIHNQSGSSSSQSDIQSQNEPSALETVALCVKCGPILAKMYAAHSEFNKLTHPTPDSLMYSLNETVRSRNNNDDLGHRSSSRSLVQDNLAVKPDIDRVAAAARSGDISVPQQPLQMWFDAGAVFRRENAAALHNNAGTGNIGFPASAVVEASSSHHSKNSSLGHENQQSHSTAWNGYHVGQILTQDHTVGMHVNTTQPGYDRWNYKGHPESQRPFVAPEFDAVSQVPSGHQKTEKLYPCTMCGKVLQNSGSLQNHLVTHSEDRPYTCSICLKSFKLKNTLKVHFLTHSIQRGTFACTICGKFSSTKTTLNRHKTKFHLQELVAGTEPPKCGRCGKVFLNVRSLNLHTRLVHEDASSMIAQMRSNTDKKVYSCKYCSKKFATQKGLGIHEATHNRGKLKPGKKSQGPNAQKGYNRKIK